MTEFSSSLSSYKFRYGVLIFAIIIASQVGSPHVALSRLTVTAFQNVANIASMEAVVAPNEYNTLAQQFSEKDRELTAREQELLLREQALDAKYQAEILANKRTTLYTVGGATLVLVLLIFANFYFDIKREEERERALLHKSEAEIPAHI